VALFVSVSAERRAARALEAQHRPIVKLTSQRFEDLKSIKIYNPGLGVALITDAEFCRGSHCSANPAEHFRFARPVMWDTFRSIPTGALRAGAELELLRLSVAGLIGQGIPRAEAREILRSWQEQKAGISVRIEYSDVFDQPQKPLVLTLK
jgi:hypothetical protein